MKDLLQKCLDFLVDNNVPNCEDLKREVKTKLHLFNDSEIIGYVSKGDLDNIGFNTDDLDGDDISDIASKLIDAYCDNGYWIDLEVIAEGKGIPKRSGIIGTFKIDGDNVSIMTMDEEGENQQELFLQISDFVDVTKISSCEKELVIYNIKEEIKDLSDCSIDNLHCLVTEIFNEIQKL